MVNRNRLLALVLASMVFSGHVFAQSTTGDDTPATPPAASKKVPADIDKTHAIAPPVSKSGEHINNDEKIPPEHIGRDRDDSNPARGGVLP